MIEKLAFCLFLIRVEGGIEDQLKVGGGRGRRRRRRRRRRSVVVSLGHGSCQDGEKKVVDGREGHCSLVFYPIDGPNDGDRYGTTTPERRSQGRSSLRHHTTHQLGYCGHFHILPTAASKSQTRIVPICFHHRISSTFIHHSDVVKLSFPTTLRSGPR